MGQVTRPVDLLVVGGGIAGLCTALAAAEQRLGVVVVDEARPGAASRAAAGMLAPSLEGLAPEARAVAIEARDAYPEFLGRLRQRTGLDVPLHRNGIIELASSAQHLALLAGRAGAAAQVLGPPELAALEPAFAGHAGAVLHPGDGAVDNVALMRSLDVAVALDARIERRVDRVAAFDFTDAGAVTVLAGGGRVGSGAVLLAPGAWTGDMPGLPRALPVRPVRGELLRLDCLPIRHVTYGGGGYLVPRGDTLLIGATSEESGFSSHTSSEGRAALLAIARNTIPAIATAHVVEHWAGLRPVTPDALPILGRDPHVPVLYYACGFSRNGILLAPWSAAIVARLIAGDAPHPSLRPFAPTRFDEPKK